MVISLDQRKRRNGKSSESLLDVAIIHAALSCSSRHEVYMQFEVCSSTTRPFNWTAVLVPIMFIRGKIDK